MSSHIHDAHKEKHYTLRFSTRFFLHYVHYFLYIIFFLLSPQIKASTSNILSYNSKLEKISLPPKTKEISTVSISSEEKQTETITITKIVQDETNKLTNKKKLTLPQKNKRHRMNKSSPIKTSKIDNNSTEKDNLIKEEKLQPKMKQIEETESTIKPMYSSKIRGFITQRLEISPENVQKKSYIFSINQQKSTASPEDLIFVQNEEGFELESPQKNWLIYKKPIEFFHPRTGEKLANISYLIGHAKMLKNSNSSMKITKAYQEIEIGDLILPYEEEYPIDYSMKPPPNSISGEIIQIGNEKGRFFGALNDSVTIDIGNNNLKPGETLYIKKIQPAETSQVIPSDESIGKILIYQVLDKISYGLVIDSSESISVGDEVTSESG